MKKKNLSSSITPLDAHLLSLSSVPKPCVPTLHQHHHQPKHQNQHLACQPCNHITIVTNQTATNPRPKPPSTTKPPTHHQHTNLIFLHNKFKTKISKMSSALRTNKSSKQSTPSMSSHVRLQPTNHTLLTKRHKIIQAHNILKATMST